MGGFFIANPGPEGVVGLGSGSVADPDPGSGAFFTPGSEMVKKHDAKPGSGSGMNNPDQISKS